MNFLLKEIKAGSFFRSEGMFIALFTGFLIFIQNSAIALSCEQLDLKDYYKKGDQLTAIHFL